RVFITLPDWAGAAAARERLLAAGFVEQRTTMVHRTPRQESFCAATMEQEIEQLAHRILDEARRGRPFREMGVVLRSRQPYAVALQTAFARFDSPAEFFF